MNIARYNEGQSVALRAFLYRSLLGNGEFLHQMLYMSEIVVIFEPGDEFGAFSGPMPSMLANSSSNIQSRAVSISSLTG